jgi:hypothetical protein
MDRQGEFELHTTQGAIEINAKVGFFLAIGLALESGKEGRAGGFLPTRSRGRRTLFSFQPGHHPGSDDPSSSLMAHSSSSSSDASHSSTDEYESQNGAATGVEQVAGEAAKQHLISLTVPTAKRAQKRKRIR